MTEWEVFLAIVAILGFCITVFKISGFFNGLNSSIASLDETISRLSGELKEVINANREGHRRLWSHNEEQDEILNNHEKRISLIENKKED